MMVSDVLRPPQEFLVRLSRSQNPSDLRKAHDLRRLLDIIDGPWAGRCELTGVVLDQRRVMHLQVQLRDVPGLVLREGRPRLHPDWDLAVMLAPHYPLARPQVRFSEPDVPWNPHVLHRGSPLDERQLPVEVQGFMEPFRRGQQGWMCYAAAWSPLITHDVVLLLWQVSRVLAGRVYGERFSLNDAARDHFLRLAREGRLPLGESLPFPDAGQTATALDPGFDQDDEAVEWAEADEATVAGANPSVAVVQEPRR